MFQPGDVVWFLSGVAGKPKYHLCVTLNGHFLFLNSPKKQQYAGDFVFSCDELPFIEATESGDSIISCTQILPMTPNELKRAKAKKKGSVSIDLLRRLVVFIENSAVLSEEDKDMLLDGLGDWI